MLKRGERVGDWVVDETLGEGGMGAVYRVHSALTPRLAAALKVLKPTADVEARARFVREAEALSALRHPAIVHVMGFSEDEKRGLLYIVMELAFGETLKARMDRGAMTLEDATRVFTRLASALEHAHAAGVYHRDLKPANVILCHDGSVRLVDFGIAATQTAEPLTGGGHLGTLSYVPPEVFRGERGDASAADVYALGLVMHEALVGRRMFPIERGLTPVAAAAAVGVKKLEQGPCDPGEGVPERVREIIRRATDPTPGMRPDMTLIRKTLVSLRERRGQVDASERTPIPGSVPGVVGPAAPRAEGEHTMRVPEPSRPAEDEGARVDRVRHRRPARSMMPLWAGAGALLLAGGLAVGLSRSGTTQPEPTQSSEVQAAPPPTTVAPGPHLVMPTPQPRGVRASPRVVATPVPTVTPAADPVLAPTPTSAPVTMAPTPRQTPVPQAPPQTGPRRTPPPVSRPTPYPPVVVAPVLEPEDDVPQGEYQPPEGVDPVEPEPEPTPPSGS